MIILLVLLVAGALAQQLRFSPSLREGKEPRLPNTYTCDHISRFQAPWGFGEDIDSRGQFHYNWTSRMGVLTHADCPYSIPKLSWTPRTTCTVVFRGRHFYVIYDTPVSKLKFCCHIANEFGMTSPNILNQVPFDKFQKVPFVNEVYNITVDDFKVKHGVVDVSIKIHDKKLVHFIGTMPTTAFFKKIVLNGEQIFYNYRELEEHWTHSFNFNLCLHCPGFGSPPDNVQSITPHYIFDSDENA